MTKKKAPRQAGYVDEITRARLDALLTVAWETNRALESCSSALVIANARVGMIVDAIAALEKARRAKLNRRARRAQKWGKR